MRINKEKEFEFWESKIVLAVFVFLLLMLLVFAVNSFYKKYQIKKEISILDKKIEKLEENKRNIEIQKNILTDKDFIEREARIKLNFKKEGEKVVVLVDTPYTKDNEVKSIEDELQKNDNLKESLDIDEKKISKKENIKKWIKVIFE